MILVIILVMLSVSTVHAGRETSAFFETGYINTGLAGSNTLPSLASDVDGTIYCAFVWKLGGIYVTSSEDFGRTWSDPTKVMDCPGNGYIADPNILITSKHMKVFATYVPGWAESDANFRFRKSETVVAVSIDKGRTWKPSESIRIPHKYASGKVHVPVWLGPKTVAMGYSYDIPADEDRPQGAEKQMYARAGVLISCDEGETWKPEGDVFVDVRPTGADEPALVRLENGDLFMVVRTGYPHPYETVSHDDGKTWEEPKE
ncbi:MAG: sialidase family protein, partial [Armatimonadota bacterium]